MGSSTHIIDAPAPPAASVAAAAADDDDEDDDIVRLIRRPRIAATKDTAAARRLRARVIPRGDARPSPTPLTTRLKWLCVDGVMRDGPVAKAWVATT